jgi:hypothetical protein
MQTVRHIRATRRIARNSPANYGYRLISGGIGHNLPQEAQAFGHTVIDVDRL